jgi:hypothetical protein
MFPLSLFLVAAMKISDLVTLAQARLAHLKNRRVLALVIGDVNELATLETSIAETEDTIARLIAEA